MFINGSQELLGAVWPDALLAFERREVVCDP
jgi:hypothetical protein